MQPVYQLKVFHIHCGDLISLLFKLCLSMISMMYISCYYDDINAQNHIPHILPIILRDCNGGTWVSSSSSWHFAFVVRRFSKVACIQPCKVETRILRWIRLDNKKSKCSILLLHATRSHQPLKHFLTNCTKSIYQLKRSMWNNIGCQIKIWWTCKW